MGTSDEEEGEKSTTGFGASLTPDYRDKEESNKKPTTKINLSGSNLVDSEERELYYCPI